MHPITQTTAFLAALLALATPGRAAERRCGWVENPTPANWWLRDREAEWTLSTMGGDPAPGQDTMPDMATRGWSRPMEAMVMAAAACWWRWTGRRNASPG